MAVFESRFERLECKYLIDERKVDQVRRDLAPYCHPDPYNVPTAKSGAISGYPVSSLYLDSPGLAFHEAKQRGDPDRLKLRIRSYEKSDFAVLELKKRISDVVEKERARIDRGPVRDIALGRVAPLEADPETRLFLSRYARLANRYCVQPSLQLRYHREAYLSSVDQYARVTFDRQIMAHRTGDWSLEPDTDHWCFYDDWWGPEFSGRPVLLELKCHAKMPGWMVELARKNGLERVSFSKYSVGIYITGRRMGQDLMRRRSAKAMR
jgi:hypothetical protein